MVVFLLDMQWGKNFTSFYLSFCFQKFIIRHMFFFLIYITFWKQLMLICNKFPHFFSMMLIAAL
jgi:hypothetical protein